MVEFDYKFITPITEALKREEAKVYIMSKYNTGRLLTNKEQSEIKKITDLYGDSFVQTCYKIAAIINLKR